MGALSATAGSFQTWEIITMAVCTATYNDEEKRFVAEEISPIVHTVNLTVTPIVVILMTVWRVP